MQKQIEILDDNFNDLCNRDKYLRRLKALQAIAKTYGAAARDSIKMLYDWENMTPGWILRAGNTYNWGKAR